MFVLPSVVLGTGDTINEFTIHGDPRTLIDNSRGTGTAGRQLEYSLLIGESTKWDEIDSSSDKSARLVVEYVSVGRGSPGGVLPCIPRKISPP